MHDLPKLLVGLILEQPDVGKTGWWVRFQWGWMSDRGRVRWGATECLPALNYINWGSSLPHREPSCAPKASSPKCPPTLLPLS